MNSPVGLPGEEDSAKDASFNEVRAGSRGHERAPPTEGHAQYQERKRYISVIRL